MLEYQNTKIVLLTNILQIGLKKFLWLKELKILFHGHMSLMISILKKLLEDFMKKNYMSNGKNMITHSIAGSTKKTQLNEFPLHKSESILS